MSEEKDTFNTIKREKTSLFKDRGSKFYGYVFPMETEEQFKERLEEIKKEHHQARHHCYAFRINPDNEYHRANDDGEPSHSAGTPILHALLSAEVINVGAVVVRYFGGTKLGVSGLINAYRSAAEMALNDALIVERVIEEKCIVTTDYQQLSSVLQILEKSSARIIERKMEYDCEFDIRIRRSELEMLRSNLLTLENVKFVGEIRHR